VATRTSRGARYASSTVGTASRYFRTREAMLKAVVDRVKELRMKMLEELVTDGLERTELVEAFVVRAGVTALLAPYAGPAPSV
jgi:AcrR family transcriptional regulator